MSYAPTLVPRPDMGPVPRVEVTFASVDAATVTATVFRSAVGRTFRVRGGVAVAAAGGFTLVDTEAPFGVPLTYRAEMFDVGGVSIGFTDTAVVVLDFDGTVIHQPLDTTRAVQVDPSVEWGGSVEWSAAGRSVRPMGRTVPVWIGDGGVGGAERVPLVFVTESAGQEDAFRSVVGGPDDPQVQVACVRTSTPLGLPQPFFARADWRRLTEPDEAWGETIVRWGGTALEVSPPAEMVFTALLKYSDLEGAFSTYSALEAAYLTYLAMESDFSLAQM